MKNSIIIVLVSLLIVFIGLTVYFYIGSQSKLREPQTELDKTKSEVEPEFEIKKTSASSENNEIKEKGAECQTISETEIECTKKITNPNDSVFFFKFTIKERENNNPEIIIKVIDETTKETLPLINVDEGYGCAYSFSYIKEKQNLEYVKFFDLDKNGFIDFVFAICWHSAYNSGDILYLFSTKEKSYREFFTTRPEYDLKNSLVSSSVRGGGVSGEEVTIFKADDGQLIQTEKISYWLAHSDLYEKREFKDGKWATTADYFFEGGNNKCKVIQRELVNKELKPKIVIEYCKDGKNNIFRRYQKFNEKGELIEESSGKFKEEWCSNLFKDTYFETNADCEKFEKLVAESGCSAEKSSEKACF